MKKIVILIVVAMAMIFTTYGQSDSTTRNPLMLGGNLGFNFHKTNDYYEYQEKWVDFNAKVVFGIFVSKKVAIGVSSDFFYFEDAELDWDKALSLRIFARYQGDIDKKFKYYIDPYIGRTYNLHFDDNETQIYEFNTGIDFGLLYYVNDKLSLELNLMEISYFRQTYEDSDELNRVFDIKYDIVQPNFGIRFYF